MLHTGGGGYVVNSLRDPINTKFGMIFMAKNKMLQSFKGSEYNQR